MATVCARGAVTIAARCAFCQWLLRHQASWGCRIPVIVFRRICAPSSAVEAFENPATLERAVVVELPRSNAQRRAVGELTALPGARVVGEHLHPRCTRFSVEQGELTVLRDGRRSTLRAGERVDIGSRP